MNRSSRSSKAVLVAAFICLVALVSAAWRNTQIASAGLDAPGALAGSPGEQEAGIGATSTLSWNIQTVDAPKWPQETTLGAHFMRLDTADRPHMAYGWNHPYYAWRDDTAWHYETVDREDKVGAYASLALDRAGNPHISYCDQANNALRYARWTGTMWQIQRVTNGGGCGHTSLELDQANAPHISYEAVDGVKYVRWTGRGWDVHTVAGGRDPALALDSTGHPAIAYTSGITLHYAWHDGQGWHDEEVFTTRYNCRPGLSRGVSLALSSNGDPSILYVTAARDGHWCLNRLALATRVDGVWQDRADYYLGNGDPEPTAIVTDNTGYWHVVFRSEDGFVYVRQNDDSVEYRTIEHYPIADLLTAVSLALDSRGDPRVSYVLADKLQFAAWRDGAWVIETVDSSGDYVGRYTSLALDKNGSPRIAYFDETVDTRKVAAPASGSWTSRSVISTTINGNTSLALDSAGAMHFTYLSPAAEGYRNTWYEPLLYATDATHVVLVGGSSITHTIEAGRAFQRSTARSLQRDAVGHLHLVYGGDHLRHAWQDGTTWRYEIVDDAPDVGENANLVIDRAGILHVSYYDRVHAAIKYAWKSTTGWQIETAARGTTGESSLAVDRSGNPRLSYISLSQDLFYAWRTAQGWQAQAVNTDWSGLCRESSLALDSIDSPQIVYHIGRGHGAGYNGLVYARWTGSNWRSQVVDSPTNDRLGGHPSLVLDATDRPHIASVYEAWDSNYWSVMYTWFTGDNWETQTVDGTAGVLWPRVSLALDVAGKPSIAYSFPDDAIFSWNVTGALKLARWTGNAWDIEEITRTGLNGGYASLVLDSAGAPHIAFGAQGAGNTAPLRIARRANTEWAIEIVDISRDITRYTSVALDAGGAPHTSYRLDGRLHYAVWANGAWSAQVADDAFGAGEYSALALDRAGLPHISYYDAIHKALKYTHWMGDAWINQVVDQGSDVGQYTSLALDNAGQPRISYYDVGNGDLRYARWTGSTWATETVDSVGNVGQYTSLALDHADQPHISYYDATAGALKYASWTGAAWDIVTVDAGGVGEYSSLALDDRDNPHISYYDAIQHALKYAVGSPMIAPADCGPVPTPGPVYTGTLPTSGTVARQISHCLDDAYVTLGQTTNLYNGNPYIRMGGRPGSAVSYMQYVDGFLFRDVRVPQGAQIVSATLQVNTWRQLGAPVQVEVAGQLSPQAEAFSATNLWPHQRLKTASRMPWTITRPFSDSPQVGPAARPPGAIGSMVTETVESPDLAGIVQEVVGQSGWQAGNNLALLISPVLTERQTVDWQAYDFSPVNAAQLTISYQMPAAMPTPAATATPSQTPTPTSTHQHANSYSNRDNDTFTPWPAWRLYLPLVLRR